MVRKVTIAYYTCTQNTEMISNHIKRIFEEKNWEVTISNLNNLKVISEQDLPDLFIIGTPVQYWDIPEPVFDKLHILSQYENTYGFVFSTYGKCVCNSVPYQLAIELKRKGIKVLGGAQIVTPHSGTNKDKIRFGDKTISFGKGQPDENALQRIKTSLWNIADKIETNTIHEFNLDKLKQLHTRGFIAHIMNFLTSYRLRLKLMPHIYHVSKNCNNCRKCEKACDSNAIKIDAVSGFILNKNMCVKCYKCIGICDRDAILTNFAKATIMTKIVHLLSRNTETRIVY